MLTSMPTSVGDTISVGRAIAPVLDAVIIFSGQTIIALKKNAMF